MFFKSYNRQSAANRSFAVIRQMANSEIGAAMLEFALVVAGIIIGILIMLDVGLAISQYMFLSQGGYEGLKFAGKVPNLEASPESGFSDIIATSEQIEACSKMLPAAIPCNHFVVQQRIRSAIEKINAFSSVGITSGTPSLTTHYIPTASGTGAQDDTVIVEINGEYQGFILPKIRLYVSMQGSYLYESI